MHIFTSKCEALSHCACDLTLILSWNTLTATNVQPMCCVCVCMQTMSFWSSSRILNQHIVIWGRKNSHYIWTKGKSTLEEREGIWLNTVKNVFFSNSFQKKVFHWQLLYVITTINQSLVERIWLRMLITNNHNYIPPYNDLEIIILMG